MAGIAPNIELAIQRLAVEAHLRTSEARAVEYEKLLAGPTRASLSEYGMGRRGPAFGAADSSARLQPRGRAGRRAS
jgi:hypothetical protein